MQKPLAFETMFHILRLCRTGYTIHKIVITLRISIGSVGNYLDSAYRNYQLKRRKSERARSSA